MYTFIYTVTYTKINTLRAHKEAWQESRGAENLKAHLAAHGSRIQMYYTLRLATWPSFRKSFQIIARHFKVIYKTALQQVLPGTSSTFGWT